jgi:hypothetical protein
MCPFRSYLNKWSKIVIDFESYALLRLFTNSLVFCTEAASPFELLTEKCLCEIPYETNGGRLIGVHVDCI